jgi:CHAT domain-containing protein
VLRQLLIPDELWDRLVRAPSVVIVPDGALHGLPFEALVVEPGSDARSTRFWLDEGPAIRYAASVTILHNVTRRPDTRPGTIPADVLSLSDPIYDPAAVLAARQTRAAPRAAPPAAVEPTRDAYERAGGTLARLPGTARETQAIQRAFGSDRSLGRVIDLRELDASEARLRSDLTGKRYVHLATHGIVDEAREALFAALALTPSPGTTSEPDDDGFLQLFEIYALRLPELELAVLSACNSNVGALVDGEGVFALARGFFAAGARRVIASEWTVNDASTAALMAAFFGTIAAAEQRGEPVDFATALRDAKRGVRNEEGWAEPYHWAPFVLMGKR